MKNLSEKIKFKQYVIKIPVHNNYIPMMNSLARIIAVEMHRYNI